MVRHHLSTAEIEALKKLFANPLTTEQEARLHSIKQESPSARPRQRAHAVLLSAAGYQIAQIAEIFDTCRQSAASWINDWNKHGESGLLDAPRSGRPRKIQPADEENVVKSIKTHPRSLKKCAVETE